MMPIPLFATISRPNMPSMIEPVASTMRNSTPRIALIRVNTFARTMSLTDRDARSGGTSFVSPPCHTLGDLLGGQAADDVVRIGHHRFTGPPRHRGGLFS